MSDSITRTPSPHLECENESVPIEVDDADVIVVEDEEEDGLKLVLRENSPRLFGRSSRE
jgi:hypothetical protein